MRHRLPAISASEARALIELVAARGIAQGELGQLLGLEKSTVSRLAAGLERKGWLRRGRDEGNQRYVRLYLTPEGRAIAEQVWRAWQSRQARIVAGLSDEERDGLAAGLRGLVRGLAAEGFLSSPPPAGGSPRVTAPPTGTGTPRPRPPGSRTGTRSRPGTDRIGFWVVHTSTQPTPSPGVPAGGRQLRRGDLVARRVLQRGQRDAVLHLLQGRVEGVRGDLLPGPAGTQEV